MPGSSRGTGRAETGDALTSPPLVAAAPSAQQTLPGTFADYVPAAGLLTPRESRPKSWQTRDCLQEGILDPHLVASILVSHRVHN